MTDLKLDPLYTIFERHLYDFDDESNSVNINDEKSNELIDRVVADYLKFLVSKKVTVPPRWKGQIEIELKEQVKQMLIKKIYGCLSVNEFVQKQKDRETKQKRRISRRKYSKLF